MTALRTAPWTLTTVQLLLAVACAADGPQQSMGFAQARPEWLAGNAAAALRPDGRLELPLPRTRGPREIGERDARAQAVAWSKGVATSIGNLRETLERSHGAPIDFANLVDCDRLYYVESVSEPVPEGAAPWIHNALGPRWLIRLCSGPSSVPAVLALAANSDLTIENGQLRFPSNSGAWFQSWGTEPGTLPLPLEPEAAIGFAFRATGQRVTEVPSLVERNVGDGPASVVAQCAFWNLTLENPVRGVGVITGAEYETRQLRVGREGCATSDTALYVALATQPDTARSIVYDFYLPDGSSRRDTVRVQLLSPYRFEQFQIRSP